MKVETQVSVSGGNHEPLWLNANKYGLSSLDKGNGYLRGGVFRSLESDSARRWAWAYGADVAVAAGFTSTFVVQQAYGELRWLKGLLTVGSKEQPAELKNQQLSSGAQTLGVNARPVPGVRLSLPDYWIVPFTRGWLGLKGHLFYGLATDDKWQKDFTARQQKYVEHSRLHTKAGYLRIGKDGRTVSVEMGLEMACQFGGTTYYTNRAGSIEAIANEGGLKGMINALIPGGGDTGEGIYANKSGNHLGSYLLRVNVDRPGWRLSAYADHFFEDHSQMFFIDYNGYGSGDEFNEWKKSHWFVYDLKDMMLGAELKLKRVSWLNDIVVEYLYTKYQSGPIYHDRTPLMSDHIAGRDGYYNNFLQTGWQHWGQVMGNPLYRSPLYNDNGSVSVTNNRFWAWHVGLSGRPLSGFSYRLLGSWQRGWGTYEQPFTNPQSNLSMLLEAQYQWPGARWSLRGAVGVDHGEILGNNTGVQFTVARRFNLKKKDR